MLPAQSTIEYGRLGGKQEGSSTSGHHVTTARAEYSAGRIHICRRNDEGERRCMAVGEIMSGGVV
jgi:hypothetical protein